MPLGSYDWPDLWGAGGQGEFAMTPKVDLGDWVCTKGRRKLEIREGKFSLRLVDFVELFVAFSGQWQDMGIYLSKHEKHCKSQG